MTPTTTTSPVAPPLKVVDHTICVVKQPAEFRDRVQNGWLVPAPGGKFHAMAVNGTRVYGTSGEDSDIYVADTEAKTVRKVADSNTGDGGTTWMAANKDFVTWLDYGMGQGVSDWSVYVANADGTKVRRVAGPAKDQHEPQDVASHPVLLGSQLAWSVFDFDAGRSKLNVMDLRTSKVRTIELAYQNSPVAMGDTLVWTEPKGEDAGTMHAVDATTLEPRELPADLPFEGGIGPSTATSDLLMWGTSDNRTLKVWNAAERRVDVFRAPAKVDQIFQFLQPTGTHLTWYTNWPYSLMDLETGVVVDLGTEVSTAAGDGVVAISYQKRLGTTKFSPFGPAHLTVVPEDELPSPDRGSCPGA